MAISVKNYTNRYLAFAILIIMAIWALLFYAVLMDEVYDNIDDGLKNQKIEIIREAYNNPQILHNSKTYGINQFRILPSKIAENLDNNHFSKKMIYMPYDEEEEPYRILETGFYSKDGDPYTLEIRTSTVEEDDFLINLAISLAVLYLVIVLSILGINYLVLNKAWKPFQKILKNLSKYRFGEAESFKQTPTKVLEFETLNLHINQMISRNEQVFKAQKRFLENASHELQTPLAITINKLELLIQDPDLSEKQLTKIVDAKFALLRMVALNKSLLMLSRIENNQYTTLEKINFNQIIKDMLMDFKEIFDHKHIQTNLEERGVFIIEFNPDLALILISNLLRNALKYNKENGVIQITIEDDTVRIANSSTTEALNPDYIFERFHKGNQDPNANGLGLSIVETILEKYPYLKINYLYESSMHIFQLKRIN